MACLALPENILSELYSSDKLSVLLSLFLHVEHENRPTTEHCLVLLAISVNAGIKVCYVEGFMGVQYYRGRRESGGGAGPARPSFESTTVNKHFTVIALCQQAACEYPVKCI